MRTSLFVPLAAAAFASFGACSSEAPKRPAVLTDGTGGPTVSGGSGGGDAGPSDAGVVDSGDGGACTDLETSSVEVDQNAVTGDVPAGTGGTITDGEYDLTDATVYVGVSGLPGPTGTRYRETLRITGTKLERVLVITTSAGATSTTASSGLLMPSGTSATIALTCPAGLQETVTYSATATGLTLSNLVTKESFVFSKRQ
jgi:hypothetical protein